VERLGPHLVVSSQSNSVDPGSRVAWYKLSHEPKEESYICLEGEYWVSENPGLEELLRIIEETEELLLSGRPLRGC